MPAKNFIEISSLRLARVLKFATDNVAAFTNFKRDQCTRTVCFLITRLK